MKKKTTLELLRVKSILAFIEREIQWPVKFISFQQLLYVSATLFSRLRYCLKKKKEIERSYLFKEADALFSCLSKATQ